jgi:hypothetical protein
LIFVVTRRYSVLGHTAVFIFIYSARRVVSDSDG